MEIVVRTSDLIAGTLPAMRAQVRELSPDLPIRRTVLLQDFIAASAASPRFYTFVLGSFAGVALLLALVGIHGTLTYAVSQRAHEIGIRVALGASGHSVLGMILRKGMILVGLGIGLGLGGAYFLTQALESLIFGVTPTDALTLTAAVTAIVVSALLASLAPAWRAIRLDPLSVLREQ